MIVAYLYVQNPAYSLPCNLKISIMDKIITRSVKVLIALLFIIALTIIYQLLSLEKYLQSFRPPKGLINPTIITVDIKKLDQHNRNIISNINPFGIIIYKNNIDNYQQLKTLITDLKAIFPNRKLLIFIDQEGGTVDRIKYVTAKKDRKFLLKKASYYSNLYQNNPKKAKKEIYRDAKYTAKIMKDLGIDFNFAPMIDIDFKNRNIGKMANRFYGDNPKIVTILAEEFIKGMKESGIQIVLKHFPGIGSAQKDTHFEKSSIAKSQKLIIKNDLLTYRKLKKYSDFALASHVTFSAVDSLPTSISKKTINFFKKNANFKGVVISDSLNMPGINDDSNDRSIENFHNIAKKMYNAGVDIVMSNCLYYECEIGIIKAANETGATENFNKKIAKFQF